MRYLFILPLLLVLTIGAYPQTSESAKLEMVYWSKDKSKCSFCDQIYVEGNSFLIFNTPEFEIAFAPIYNNKVFFLSMYLVNKSNARIDFDPDQARIAVYKEQGDKTPVEFSPYSPGEVAKRMKSNQGLKNFFTRFAAGLAQQTTRETGTLIDNQGNTIVYSGESSRNDASVRQRAEELVAERNKRATSRAESYQNAALQKNTLFREQELMGNIYFPLIKGHIMWVAVRVGNKVYVGSVRGIQ